MLIQQAHPLKAQKINTCRIMSAVSLIIVINLVCIISEAALRAFKTQTITGATAEVVSTASTVVYNKIVITTCLLQICLAIVTCIVFVKLLYKIYTIVNQSRLIIKIRLFYAAMFCSYFSMVIISIWSIWLMQSIPFIIVRFSCLLLELPLITLIMYYCNRLLFFRNRQSQIMSLHRRMHSIENPYVEFNERQHISATTPLPSIPRSTYSSREGNVSTETIYENITEYVTSGNQDNTETANALDHLYSLQVTTTSL